MLPGMSGACTLRAHSLIGFLINHIFFSEMEQFLCQIHWKHMREIENQREGRRGDSLKVLVN